MTVESDVLTKITPSVEERLRIDGIAQKLRTQIQEYLDTNDIHADLKFTGSYSKDTYLSDPDLDLFVRFPVGTPREELEEVGLRIGEEVLHGTRMYADHPYITARFEGVDVDLVPCIRIEDTSTLATAVDRTPFHTEYINTHIGPNQNGQIRLLKKFMKAVGTYGAEPKNRGFSGYLCEILVLKYGSFEGVLQAAARHWKIGTVIWIEKKGPQIDDPLVFYDPVDPKRNVASAVHQDTLSRFIVAAKDYLAHPSEIFFFPPKKPCMTEHQIEAAADCGKFRLISIIFDRPDTVEDNVYAQLWKTQYAVQTQLERYGFTPLHATHGYDGSRMTIIFMLTCDHLHKSMKRIGPAVDVSTAAGFLEKWEKEAIVKPFIEDGKWCAVVPVPYTSAKEMLREQLPHSGIGKNIDMSSIEILDHDRTVHEADRCALSRILDPTPYWRRP